MFKANTTIIAGGKIYHDGQTVQGLSKIDRDWMEKAGYITESTRKKENPIAEAPAVEQSEDKKDEF